MNTPGERIQQPSLLDPQAAPPAEPQWQVTAQVLVDTGLPHLDRPFDYGVPESMTAALMPGVRVKVRFAGRDRDGYVISLGSATDQRLSPVGRTVGTVPVLAPQVLRAAQSVAAHYAGCTTDVLRLAIPPRHASAEKSLSPAPPAAAITGGVFAPSEHGGPWDDYQGGPAFLRRVAHGLAPRAVWSALPSAPWAQAIAAAVSAVRAAGRGALVLVPDARDIAQVTQALNAADIAHVALSADQGVSARYRRFLQVLYGQVHVVVGTRSAAFAPIQDLGLVVCWDDGDDLHAEPRAPYPHIREILVQRAELEGAAALIGGYARTPAAQRLVAEGWARSLQAGRSLVRQRSPHIMAPSQIDLAREGAAATARFPRPAWELVRQALTDGPVLIQSPRSGYLPGLSCARCRTPARCPHCHGPLALPTATAAPVCRWCTKSARAWQCHECEHDQVRAMRVGSSRTAEELGRAFAGVPILRSGRDGEVTPAVDDTPRLVVATPGAEPIATDGYAAAVLLDGAIMTAREDLDASTEALRRWLNAAALVRSNGRVMLLGDPPSAPAQALVRWDPTGYAERELMQRTELGFPPITRLATLTGSAPAVRDFLARLQLPAMAQVIEPQPVGSEPDLVRAIVRSPRAAGGELAAALKAVMAGRSARKQPVVRVLIDPSVI
ncbi:MAG: primosomal protein N' [Beutenbergiaceae bacterium]